MSKELKYQQVKAINASVGGFFGDTYHIEIDLQNRKLHWYQGDKDEPGAYQKTVRQATVDQLLADLKQINILNWKAEYVDPDVLDGTQWEVEISLDGRRLEKYGSNAYPEEWEHFCRIIRKISRKPFH